jgi:hypothetical protein
MKTNNNRTSMKTNNNRWLRRVAKKTLRKALSEKSAASWNRAGKAAWDYVNYRDSWGRFGNGPELLPEWNVRRVLFYSQTYAV